MTFNCVVNALWRLSRPFRVAGAAEVPPPRAQASDVERSAAPADRPKSTLVARATRSSDATRRGREGHSLTAAAYVAWACITIVLVPAPGLAADTTPDEDAAPSSVKISGFLDALGAYTYSEPSHWSRAVGRLQLNATGAFSENVKWKLGGRVDVDPVYFSNDFYPDAVQRDQRLRFFHGENYIDVSTGDWNFRFGAQQIVWGEVVGLFFADVVSAHDLREFLLPSFDIIRIPQWAARAEYFKGDSHLELVWIPVPVFDEIGKPGSDFYPAPLPHPLPREIEALFSNPDRPARTIGNGNFGIRANTLIDGWDVAGFYYRSFSTSPTFYQVPGPSPDLPFAFEPRYDRIWQTGATMSKDFEDFVLRAEAVYTNGQGFSVSDPAVSNGVAKRNTFDYIVSFDIPLPHDTRLNLQAFQNKVLGGDSDFEIKRNDYGASVLISSKITSTLEPQLLWIQYAKEGGGLIRPRLNWYPARNTTVGFGVDIFTGPADGFFGQYNHRDRAYAELRYDF
jgi:hypothetical protein